MKVLYKGWKYPWRLRNILHNIKRIALEHKDMFERARYGVAKRDCWDLNNYLNKVMLNALDTYKKETIGYPGMLTPKEWDNVLDHMMFLISEMEKTDSDESEAIWEEYAAGGYRDKDLRKKWFKSCEEFAEYQEDCKFELFDLMKEWYNHLWW